MEMSEAEFEEAVADAIDLLPDCLLYTSDAADETLWV